MKLLSAVTVSVLLLAAIGTTTVDGFQWMSKFKMPTYDPQQELVQEKFGDKSEYQ
jgi:hypothetical protein